MPWTRTDYPDSFKNLEPEIRNKAIEIANALLREDYDEGRAISIATAKAREYVTGDDNDRPTYVAKARDDHWVLMKKEGEKAIFKEETKNELLERAKPYVNAQNGVLAIYHMDGTLETTLYE
ncbi:MULTISPECIES: hypothetical protein [Sporosarcina]|uniref:DUF2188 domain-containing protein n=1 Tax=Sporosarcina contaminans TaxID=633403 RepID=A0ABW3U1L4_9BACL